MDASPWCLPFLISQHFSSAPSRAFRLSPTSVWTVWICLATFLLLPFLGQTHLRTSESVEVILNLQFSSVQFSQSVMSESLQPHGLHHARNPCPSATPRVSNSFPFIYLKKIWGSKITADGDCGHELKDTYSLKEKL